MIRTTLAVSSLAQTFSRAQYKVAPAVYAMRMYSSDAFHKRGHNLEEKFVRDHEKEEIAAFKKKLEQEAAKNPKAPKAAAAETVAAASSGPVDTAAVDQLKAIRDDLDARLKKIEEALKNQK
eukprot:TRINITY_DN4976_c0_g1_i1.p2 TRINITY_DN4976_c0_g1~~TRINITY_DN4976_c0_g1_i1.p2  ORF type:complete len:135 (-),score=85.11 TRINITY_DN4976_c0_g1_i1:43-408(-)